MAVDENNAIHPLQPGDPFKKGNFNRFAFGMMAFMILFGAIAVASYFLYFRRHQPVTKAPSSQSLVILGRAVLQA